MIRRNSRKTIRQQVRIRQGFENVHTVEINPAKRDFTDEERKKLRVAGYCRGSTFDESQTSSFDLSSLNIKG